MRPGFPFLGLVLVGLAGCGSSDDPTGSDPPNGEPPPTYTYSVDALPAQGGSTSPAPGSLQADSGSTVVVQAVAATGWGFREWRGDASGSDAQLSQPLNSDGQTLTAYFDCGPSVSAGGCFSPPHGPDPGPDFGWAAVTSDILRAQTFRPLTDRVTAVAVELFHANPQIPPAPIAVTIWATDALTQTLAQGSVVVPDDFEGGWLTIPMDGGGSVVDPGVEIVFAVWSDNSAYGWMYAGFDQYPDGRARWKDAEGNWRENTSSDFFFRINPLP